MSDTFKAAPALVAICRKFSSQRRGSSFPNRCSVNMGVATDHLYEEDSNV